MTPEETFLNETLFKGLTYSIFVVYIFLWVLPSHKITNILIVRWKLPVLFYAAIYSILLIGSSLGWDSRIQAKKEIERPSGMGSLVELVNAFGNMYVCLLAWVHYLVFDMIIVILEFEDCRQFGIPHLVFVPVSLLTVMFGPSGYLLYFVVRFVLLRKVSHLHLNEEKSYETFWILPENWKRDLIEIWFGTPEFWRHFLRLPWKSPNDKQSKVDTQGIETQDQ